MAKPKAKLIHRTPNQQAQQSRNVTVSRVPSAWNNSTLGFAASLRSYNINDNRRTNVGRGNANNRQPVRNNERMNEQMEVTPAVSNSPTSLRLSNSPPPIQIPTPVRSVSPDNNPFIPFAQSTDNISVSPAVSPIQMVDEVTSPVDWGSRASSPVSPPSKGGGFNSDIFDRMYPYAQPNRDVETQTGSGYRQPTITEDTQTESIIANNSPYGQQGVRINRSTSAGPNGVIGRISEGFNNFRNFNLVRQVADMARPHINDGIRSAVSSIPIVGPPIAPIAGGVASVAFNRAFPSSTANISTQTDVPGNIAVVPPPPPAAAPGQQIIPNVVAPPPAAVAAPPAPPAAPVVNAANAIVPAQGGAVVNGVNGANGANGGTGNPLALAFLIQDKLSQIGASAFSASQTEKQNYISNRQARSNLSLQMAELMRKSGSGYR